MNMFHFIYLFLAVLGLHCWAGFSLVAASGSFSLVVIFRLLIVVVSLVADSRAWWCGLQELQQVGQVVVILWL